MISSLYMKSFRCHPKQLKWPNCGEAKATNLTEFPPFIALPLNKHTSPMSAFEQTLQGLKYCWHRYLKIATYLCFGGSREPFFLSLSLSWFMAYTSPAVQIPLLQSCIGRNGEETNVPFVRLRSRNDSPPTQASSFDWPRKLSSVRHDQGPIYTGFGRTLVIRNERPGKICWYANHTYWKKTLENACLEVSSSLIYAAMMFNNKTFIMHEVPTHAEAYKRSLQPQAIGCGEKIKLYRQSGVWLVNRSVCLRDFNWRRAVPRSTAGKD